MKPCLPSRRLALVLCLCLLLSVGATGVCQAQTASGSGGASQRAEPGVLVNADVIKLLESNLSHAAIIDVIGKSQSRFDVGPTGMAELINANVPDAVITAMVEAARGQATERTEPGVLVNDDVIKLLESNVARAAIIDVIGKSKSRFDIGPTGMAGLIDASVPEAVIAAMVESVEASGRPRTIERPAVLAPPQPMERIPPVDRTPAVERQTDEPRGKSFSVVNLKLGGGASTVSIGDWKTFYDGYSDYLVAYAAKSGEQLKNRYEAPSYMVNGSLDVVLRFTRVLGVGVGVGYLRASKKNTVEMRWSGGSDQDNTTLVMSAIPVRFAPYVFIPLSSSVEAYVSAGPAFYMAKAKETTAYSSADSWDGPYRYDSTFDVKKNALGFEGAVGVKFNLGSTMGFFVECAGRYANLGPWTGHYSYSNSDGTSISRDATLTYYEAKNSYTNLWVPYLSMPSSPLTNTSTRQNVRDAKVDFSGVGLTVGAIIRF